MIRARQFASHLFGSCGLAAFALGAILAVQPSAFADITVTDPSSPSGDCETTARSCNTNTCTTGATDCLTPTTKCNCGGAQAAPPTGS